MIAAAANIGGITEMLYCVRGSMTEADGSKKAARTIALVQRTEDARRDDIGKLPHLNRLQIKLISL